MRRLGRFLCVLAIGVAGASCASASAKAKPVEAPPMNVPPHPQRVIEPPPAAEPEPEPVGDLPPVAPAPAPAHPRAASRPPAENRPESKPAQEPAQQEPAPVPPPPAAPPQPAPQLRTPQTANTGEAERAVRATIDRARGLLGTINYGLLSDERKKAYNDVKMLLDQAEAASKQGNFMVAQGVATKAETLAKELAGR